MCNSNLQIIQLYRQGLTAEEIASSLKYPIETVEAVIGNSGGGASAVQLSENTPMDKEAKLAQMEARFAKLEDLAFRTMEEILLGSESDAARSRIAVFVAEQRMGLKKAADPNAGVQINQLFVRLAQVQERRRILEGETVVVPTESTCGTTNS